MLLFHPANYHKEDQLLAPYAVKSSQSKGRVYPESEDPYRTSFQRDRDRIIHSNAFRRLKGKTQVFVAHFGDHYRSRLSHSMEVAQLARDAARALELNEDLAEAIALAHDLGHTPFGHAGEEALDELMQAFNSRFEHNQQSLRIVEVIEKRYPNFPGLNLNYETRQGLRKHDPPTEREFSLEASLVDKVDAIAYYSHDLEDGLRAKIISVEQLEQVPLWKHSSEEIDITIPQDQRNLAVIRSSMKLLMRDLLEETWKRIQYHKITSLQQVYTGPHELVGFSGLMEEKADQLADFLGEHFYFHPTVFTQAQKGKEIIRKLFKSFSDHDQLLPLDIRQQFEFESRHIVLKDYIAGMTDAFALNLLKSWE